MKSILIIVFSLLYSASAALCQSDSKMYLVMSYVDNFERDSLGNKYSLPNHQEYHKILFNINEDTLVVYDTLNIFPKYGLNKIIQYSDKKLFYFEERNMYRFVAPFFFSFLDYSGDSLVIRRYNSDRDSLFLKHYSSYTETFEYNNQIWIKNQFEKKLNKQAINKNFIQKRIQSIDYQNIYRSGTSSPFQSQPTYSYKYPFVNLKKNKISYKLNSIYEYHSKNIGSKLKISNGYNLDDYNKMQDAWIQIPNEYRDSTIGQVGIVINNDRYFVGGGNSKLKRSTNGMFRDYRWVYHKKSNTLDTLLFDGPELYILKNYRDWLYGTAILKPYLFNQKYSSKNKQERAEQQLKNDELVKNKYNENNGKPPFLLNKLGEHILIHLPTKKRIKWKTRSLDSEILLIREDKIYFRNYDEIKCVDIDTEKLEIDWSSETILVKDKDIVPFVHHIFFSSSKQTKLKEVWVN